MEEENYEERRLRNIASNRALLEALGLIDFKIPDAVKPAKKSGNKRAPTTKRKARPNVEQERDDEIGNGGSTPSAPKKQKTTSELAGNESAAPRRSARSAATRSSARISALLQSDAARSKKGSAKIAKDEDEGEDDDEEEYGDEGEEESDDERPKARRERQARPKQRNVPKMKGRTQNPKTYGAIPGVSVGAWWATRAECSTAAIHAPWVAGIDGDQRKGAYSIALSGGYDDDVDMGNGFTYTGAGGRDLRGTKEKPKNLRTAPQSSDQTFENRLNKCLQASVKSKNPVRVIRGYKLKSPYAPVDGYRYDGLYVVEKAWMEKGLNPGGFLVCKYALRRLEGQPPLQITRESSEDEESEGDEDEGENEEADEMDNKEIEYQELDEVTQYEAEADTKVATSGAATVLDVPS